MPGGLQFSEARERYLPITLASLRRRMLADPRLSAVERGQLGKLVEMIASRFHLEFRDRLEHLKAVYDPLDPDRGSPVRADSRAEGTPPYADLARSMERLLLEANYVEMPREQVVTCVEYQSQAGLVVQSSLADYAELRVFYRGVRHEHRKFRPWLMPWLWRNERIHVLGRVALLVRLARNPTGTVCIKLFKDVVAEDLEMLLPYVRIRMRLVDHVKIGSSVAGGVATSAWKAFTAAALLTPTMFVLVMSGFLAAALRGTFSFLSSKTRYMQALSANLYFQNLANNSSALAHLVDAAEAEECKELLLAYYMLYAERDRDYTQEQLDRRVEHWLRAEFGLDVDFEVSEAVRKLRDKQLLAGVHASAPPGAGSETILKVYDLPSALRRLGAMWNGYFRDVCDRQAEEDRLADGRWPPYPEAETAVRRIDPGEPPTAGAAARPMPALRKDRAC